MKGGWGRRERRSKNSEGDAGGIATYRLVRIAIEFRRTDMPRVIAVGSQKGGIGKTTTAANLAVAWDATGQRVLAVDLDPQFALTRRFGSRRRRRRRPPSSCWPAKVAWIARSWPRLRPASISSRLTASWRTSSF